MIMTTRISSNIDARTFRKIVNNSIKTRFTKIHDALEDSMEIFARYFSETSIIDDVAAKNQDYELIMSQFLSRMSFIHSTSELQEHCQIFISVLDKLGGAVKTISSELSSEWNLPMPQHSVITDHSSKTDQDSVESGSVQEDSMLKSFLHDVPITFYFLSNDRCFYTQ